MYDAGFDSTSVISSYGDILGIKVACIDNIYNPKTTLLEWVEQKEMKNL